VSLQDKLRDPATGRVVVDDAVRILDEEVAARSGLSGMAVKAGYKTVKALKPGMIQAALGMLLPEFAPVVEPHWERAKITPDPRGYFRAHAGEIADGLLGVTDRRAARAQNAVMKKVYAQLRPSAREHTMAGVPRLVDLLQRHGA
jgi:hypothetical protein